jgi:hypothetical protein
VGFIKKKFQERKNQEFFNVIKIMWITCNFLIEEFKSLPPQPKLTQQACIIIKNRRAVILTRKLIRANTRIIRQKDNALVQTQNKKKNKKQEKEKQKIKRSIKA